MVRLGGTNPVFGAVQHDQFGAMSGFWQDVEKTGPNRPLPFPVQVQSIDTSSVSNRKSHDC